MRHTPFRTVLEDVLGLAGYPYDSASQAQLDMAARFINRHVRTFWEWGPWPEWTRAEERAFASPYYATVNYKAGDVVYLESADAYYEAQEDVVGESPDESSKWIEVELPADREIAYAQNGKRIMGRVWRVTKYDPYLTERADQYTFAHNLHPAAISVRGCNDSQVWVLYSDPSPTYTAKIWTKEAADAGYYQRYDVVFYPGEETTNTFPYKGLCYYADFNQNGVAVWVPVYFPKAAQEYVTFKAGADMLRHYGQKELAPTYDAQGDNAILLEWDKVNITGTQNVIGVGQ